MEWWKLESKLMAWLFVIVVTRTARAYSPHEQSHRFFEELRALDAARAAGSSSTRPAVPASPAVAMNPPADDQDDGSIQAPARKTQLRFDLMPQPTAVQAAATAAARWSDAAADAQQPAVPQLDLELELNQQRFSASDKAGPAMVWSPDDAWGTWGSAALQAGSEPTSYSIQLSSFSNGDSPQRVVVSGSVNGKPLDAAAAAMLAGGSSSSSRSSSRKPAFKPQTLADITDTLSSFGLAVDWGHEDAWRLVHSVEQQVEQQMVSVQGVFDSMLADATEGLVRLESLADGGLFDWQQRSLGLGGRWRRKLRSSNSGVHRQLDVLRLLTSKPLSQQ